MGEDLEIGMMNGIVEISGKPVICKFLLLLADIFNRGVPTIKPTVSDSGEKENSPPEAAKKDDTSTQTGLDTPQAENGNGPPSVAQVTDNKTTPGEASSSKKRAREEDDNPEGEVVAKKLDTKSEES